jgi:hypothetical protein
MREFFDEFTYFFTLAVVITLFVVGFKAVIKVGSSKVPNPAIQELFAS